ncbi:hsp70-binding protein 1-like [Ornithodoros turicata]|uniref:hsp70-binding protein 1-like n=1 Tax=Ornithodoros turicata TaxID=34597 RepID=UPI00313A1647
MSGEGPRNPSNLPGLLNFCVQHTRSEDASNESPSEMDPERRKWLAEALEDMSISPVEEMRKNLSIIQDTLKNLDDGPGEITEDACGTLVTAMENIIDFAGSVDYARDFHKIGGYTVLDRLLGFPSPAVCTTTCELMAELVQNNPYCQREAAPHLKKLLSLVDNASDDASRVKALYAISCLVRHNPPGYELFEQLDGFSVLLRTLQSDVTKLKVKACFLINSLCSQQPKSRDSLLKMGFIELLAGILQQEREGPHHEYLLATLATLCTESPAARTELARPQLGMEAVLRELVLSLEGRDDLREVRQHCSTILDSCFKEGAIADR